MQILQKQRICLKRCSVRIHLQKTVFGLRIPSSINSLFKSVRFDKLTLYIYDGICSYSPFQKLSSKSRVEHGRVGKMVARFRQTPKVASSDPSTGGTFLHFLKNLRNFYKNHISSKKITRNTNPALKKFRLNEKPFEINFFRFQRVFR